MKRLKTLLVVSILLLLAAGFVLWRLHRHAASSAPPALVSLLPPDAPVLFYLDASGLRASPFFSQLLALLPPTPPDPDYARFVRETGFNYSRDLGQLAGAAWPRSVPPRVFVIADGRFHRDKIRRYALASGSSRRVAGREILIVPSQARGKSLSLAFLSPRRLALADGPGLETFLAPGPPSSSASPSDFAALSAKFPGAVFFAVARASALQTLAPQSPQSGQLARLLSRMDSLALYGRPNGQDMQIVLDARTDSLAAALALSSELEGLRFLIRAALADPQTRRRIAPQDAALFSRLLPATSIESSGSDVLVRLTLTPQMLHAPANVPSGASR
jgi:hypothetical protein